MVRSILKMRWLFACVLVIFTLLGLFILGRSVTLPEVWWDMLYGSNLTKYFATAARRCRTMACHVIAYAARLITTAQEIVPRTLVESVRGFSAGAMLAVSVGKTLSVAASGYVQDCIHTQEEAVRLYTTSKFWTALGASCCELALIKLLYSEKRNSRRRNGILRWFNSPLGWVILIILMAIPNGILPIGVLIVCICQLSDAVYVPAILISNFIRPYIVAVMRNSPRLGLMKKICSTQYNTPVKYQPHEKYLSYVSGAVELILGVVVLFAVRFVLAARITPDDDDDGLLISPDHLERGSAKDVLTTRHKRKSKNL